MGVRSFICGQGQALFDTSAPAPQGGFEEPGPGDGGELLAKTWIDQGIALGQRVRRDQPSRLLPGVDHEADVLAQHLLLELRLGQPACGRARLRGLYPGEAHALVQVVGAAVEGAFVGDLDFDRVPADHLGYKGAYRIHYRCFFLLRESRIFLFTDSRPL